MTKQIALPDDVYETLHFAALAFGGVGAGGDWDYDGDKTCPMCIHGLAQASDTSHGFFESPVATPLYDAGILRDVNDAAVRRINTRKGARSYTRVTWEEWCAELNVVCESESVAHRETR